MPHHDIIGDYDEPHFPEPHGMPPWPTRVTPGTLAKIIIYRWRDSNGYTLDHPRDKSIRKEHRGMVITPSELERLASVPDIEIDEDELD